jgi:hypothetical protein
MKRAIKKVMVSCAVAASFVGYAAQEQEEQSPPVFLRMGAVLNFKLTQAIHEEMAGDLAQEHAQEIKAQEELNQARLEALAERLEAEGKSEQEVFALLKIEQDKFDAEMKELRCKQTEAQHAKMAEFLSSELGHGQDRYWPVDGGRQESGSEDGSPRNAAQGSGQDDQASGREDFEDWDALFLDASIADGKPVTGDKPVGDL